MHDEPISNWSLRDVYRIVNNNLQFTTWESQVKIHNSGFQLTIHNLRWLIAQINVNRWVEILRERFFGRDSPGEILRVRFSAREFYTLLWIISQILEIFLQIPRSVDRSLVAATEECALRKTNSFGLLNFPTRGISDCSNCKCFSELQRSN